MNNKNLRVYVELKRFSRMVNIDIYEKVSGGKISALTNLVFTQVDEFCETAPALSLSPETIQELIDQLWQCGFRPSEGTGSAGSLEATENHLKDLQMVTNRLLSMIERV